MKTLHRRGPSGSIGERGPRGHLVVEGGGRVRFGRSKEASIRDWTGGGYTQVTSSLY